MESQNPLFPRLVLTIAAATLALVGDASAQALSLDEPTGAPKLVVVTVPLGNATSVAWLDEEGVHRHLVAGSLTLAAAVAERLAGTSSPVVVAVGSASLEELRSAVLAAAPATERMGVRAVRERRAVATGAVERRLGPAGAQGRLRLEVELPDGGDARRSAVEVLWEALPLTLAGALPGALTRIEGDRAVLEAETDAESAEFQLRKLRVELARIAASPELDPVRIEEARTRLEVRRQAALGSHPDGAALVLERWLRGGDDAVRELLFGLTGVTTAGVQNAAREWLPQHPGRAILVLPPRVLKPRFPEPPQITRLGNDLAVAVLERPGTDLSAVVLRPVLVPDVDGQLTATLLARLAADLRRSDAPPGWVRVRERPPALELASAPNGFGELLEGMQHSLASFAESDVPIEAPGIGQARRRALDLIGSLLGLSSAGGVSTAEVLRPDNLALGLVAPDGEAASEALRKLQVGGPPTQTFSSGHAVTPASQTRAAATGEVSTLVVALEQGAVPARARVVAELLERRAADLLPTATVETLRPLVPGRDVLLLVLSVPGDLDEVERRVTEVWPRLTRPVREDELAPVRRAVAARLAAEGSGALGQARYLADVAAEGRPWRTAAEAEMDVLAVPDEEVNRALEMARTWDVLETAGAGSLPISSEGGPSDG